MEGGSGSFSQSSPVLACIATGPTEPIPPGSAWRVGTAALGNILQNNGLVPSWAGLTSSVVGGRDVGCVSWLVLKELFLHGLPTVVLRESDGPDLTPELLSPNPVLHSNSDVEQAPRRLWYLDCVYGKPQIQSLWHPPTQNLRIRMDTITHDETWHMLWSFS